MHTYVKIVDAGLISAWLPCSWLGVEIRCRVTRQLVVVWGCPFKGQMVVINDT